MHMVTVQAEMFCNTWAPHAHGWVMQMVFSLSPPLSCGAQGERKGYFVKLVSPGWIMHTVTARADDSVVLKARLHMAGSRTW